MPRQSSSDFAILGLLTIEPMSGYDIRKFVKEVLSNFWNESYGRIYPLLADLHERGFVTKSLQKQGGKPDRHVYKITDRGRRELQAWLRLPAQPTQIRSEMSLKIFLGANLPVEENLQAVERLKRTLLAEKAALAAFEKAQAEESDGSIQWEYFGLTLLMGQILNEARLRWCGLAAKRLTQREEAEPRSKSGRKKPPAFSRKGKL